MNMKAALLLLISVLLIVSLTIRLPAASLLQQPAHTHSSLSRPGRCPECGRGGRVTDGPKLEVHWSAAACATDCYLLPDVLSVA